MKNKNLILFLSGILALAMASCGGESDQSNTETEQPELTSDEPVGFGDQGSQTYAVPSPNELFTIIKESQLPYKAELISTDAVNYTSSKNQALNFGRITADIAYTASYEKFQESMSNFENLRKIGTDLGISYVFDELMVNRVTNNMDNPDSLEVISASSYQSIIEMLEQNEKGSTLAIIAAGGFIESIYILTNLVGEYSENNEVIQRLADEKLVIENIVDYLKMHSEESRVQEVLNEMEPVINVYSGLAEEKVSDDRREDGKVILGGMRVLMTAEQFNALKEAATNYRNSFANTSQS